MSVDGGAVSDVLFSFVLFCVCKLVFMGRVIFF